MIRHVEAKPKCVKLQSPEDINDLKACFLALQRLIDGKIKDGKKGLILNKGTDAEYKMSYKKLQGLLWELDTYFGLRGAFTYGICADCKHFHNACSTDGTFGKCQEVTDKVMFDSCKNFEKY